MVVVLDVPPRRRLHVLDFHLLAILRNRIRVQLQQLIQAPVRQSEAVRLSGEGHQFRAHCGSCGSPGFFFSGDPRKGVVAYSEWFSTYKDLHMPHPAHAIVCQMCGREMPVITDGMGNLRFGASHQRIITSDKLTEAAIAKVEVDHRDWAARKRAATVMTTD